MEGPSLHKGGFIMRGKDARRPFLLLAVLAAVSGSTVLHGALRRCGKPMLDEDRKATLGIPMVSCADSAVSLHFVLMPPASELGKRMLVEIRLNDERLYRNWVSFARGARGGPKEFVPVLLMQQPYTVEFRNLTLGTRHATNFLASGHVALEVEVDTSNISLHRGAFLPL